MAMSKNVCSVTGLTDDEKVEAQKVWKLLIGTSPEQYKQAGVNQLVWMFDTIPNMKALFTKFSANKPWDQLAMDQAFLTHMQSVIQAEELIFLNLFNLPKLKSVLNSLIVAHLDLPTPVGKAFFESLARGSPNFLQGQLGLPPEDPGSEAWCKVLAALAGAVGSKEEERAAKARSSVAVGSKEARASATSIVQGRPSTSQQDDSTSSEKPARSSRASFLGLSCLRPKSTIE